MDKLTSNERKTAGKLHSDLYAAFAWSDTVEGPDYWGEVADKLARLARAPGTCVTCGHVKE